MADVNTGSCLCGAVRLRTSGPLRDVVGCHCSQCRKQTGLYLAATNAATADLTIDGKDSISWYRSSPTASRAFCKTCGSALFWVADDADQISIMAGLFDDPNALKMGHHIYCADNAGFYGLHDGLPQFPQSD